ncbi:hypothetical protein A4U53_025730 [Rhizobium ruizarguesonis]|uniref:Uncharacterized protein n=1 Tax=Rhizobium ruizarguesonis TaxID=2081791 RepID=A0ACD5EKC7_9HYPH
MRAHSNLRKTENTLKPRVGFEQGKNMNKNPALAGDPTPAPDEQDEADQPPSEAPEDPAEPFDDGTTWSDGSTWEQ